ncbi:MAG: efflux RND transporter periplasmic adaptor subunit [Candidatus Riflebacteria bacterium]|nr:efflux RND transporter periplasmic adaptor subunit [Candidatus Riflebacteria bacterium]
MKKLIAVFIVGAIVAWFITDKLFQNNSKEQTQKKGGREVSVAVETYPLKRGHIKDIGIFSGSIEADSKFTVSPKIGGRIKKLYVDIGDKIYNGGIIARLDDEELILGVKQAESALEIAKANYNESKELLEISQKELERIKTMHKQKVASEVEVENTQASNKTRQAKHLVNKSLVSQAESTLETAKLKLAYANIDASWTDGAKERFIAEKFLNEGAMITANTPIVSVIDIDDLTVALNVVERDYFRIKPGMKAIVKPSAMPKESFAATVSRIAPLIDESSRQARIELKLPNTSRKLKPGMFVQVEIVYEAHENVLIAPLNAVSRRNNQEGIFIAERENKKAKFMPIVFGLSSADEIEIISPLIEGEVVTLGQHLLEDGMKIIISDSSTIRETEKNSAQ